MRRAFLHGALIVLGLYTWYQVLKPTSRRIDPPAARGDASKRTAKPVPPPRYNWTRTVTITAELGCPRGAAANASASPSRAASKKADPPRTVRLIHVPKTAGTAIQRYLATKEKGVRSEDYATWRRLLGVGNISAAFACRAHHVPPGWLEPNPYRLSGHETLCVVRHPAERLLSEFRMKTPEVQGLTPHRRQLALERFLRKALDTAERGGAGPQCHYLPQFMYVWGARGERTCDHVLQYENLTDAFARLMKSTQVVSRGWSWGKEAPLLDRNYSPGRNRRSYKMPDRSAAVASSQLGLDSIPPEIRQRIYRVYFEDYCRFGYSA